MYVYIHTYIYIYIYTHIHNNIDNNHKHDTNNKHIHNVLLRVFFAYSPRLYRRTDMLLGSCYGQFSKFNVRVCGLDSGNLKFETVRKNKQHICF